MTAAGGPLRVEGFPKRRCQFEFIAAKPYLNPRKGRSSLFVKTRHHTRLGCGEISLAGFPRGSPYETAAGRGFFCGLLIIFIASMRYRRGRPVKASVVSRFFRKFISSASKYRNQIYGFSSAFGCSNSILNRCSMSI